MPLGILLPIWQLPRAATTRQSRLRSVLLGQVGWSQRRLDVQHCSSNYDVRRDPFDACRCSGRRRAILPSTSTVSHCGQLVRPRVCACPILIGRFVSAGVGLTLAVALLVYEPGGRALIVSVVVSSGFIGIGIALGGPAMQSVVPELVTSAELRTAVALNTTPVTIGRLVGATSAATAGPAWSIMILLRHRACSASVSSSFEFQTWFNRLAPRARSRFAVPSSTSGEVGVSACC